MASWLDEYQNIKTDMERAFNDAVPAVEQLIVYQELIYRIGVLETAKALCSSAPVTTDTKPLVQHYQLVDAFLRCVVSERRFGLPADVKLKERRQTASDALTKVHADCRKRFRELPARRRKHLSREHKPAHKHRAAGLDAAAQRIYRHTET